ncbi:hypothetical protein ACNO8X_18395 [Mycobacterium sp. PDNC021]|uniref:hypothetical protein n=1 Tax=Mycobacterium sp. PDNC021 TaxID=3391399 RepID=UPI003AB01E60
MKHLAMGTCYERLVSELVAYEFIGPPPAGWEATTVAHRDGDRSNCHANNLMYMVSADAENFLEQRESVALMRGAVHIDRENRLRKVSLTRDMFDYPQHGQTSSAYRRGTVPRAKKKREGADLTRNPPWLQGRHRMVQTTTRFNGYNAEYSQAA